jgi:AraC-like DNA-binding protein
MMDLTSAFTAPKRPRLGSGGVLLRFCPHVEDLRSVIAKDIPIHALQAQTYPTQLLAFCKHGDGEIYIRGRTLAMHTGDAFLIRGREVFGYRIGPGLRQPNYLGNIRIPDALDQILSPRVDGRPWGDLLPSGVATVRYPGLMRRLAGPIRRLFESRSREQSLAVVREVAEIVASATFDPESVVRGPSPQRPAIVQAVFDRLAHELPARLNLAELASEMGCTPAQIIRVFRREMGLTPHQYLLCRRLTVGLATLSARLPVGDAVDEGAFADQAHLTRLLKAISGQTPGRYLDWLSRARRAS